MEKKFTTPLMKQYLAIKARYPDCVLFFRLGDFYEMFMEDAHIGARVLDITLTARPEGRDGKVPMAGVPYHAVDSYLAKMVKAGYRVAICEQLSEPNKKGIVERDVVRIVTPGTLVDEKALDRKVHNYTVSLAFDTCLLSLAWADLSTGDICATEIEYSNLEQVLTNELHRLRPSECILEDEKYNDRNLLKILSKEKDLNIYSFGKWKEYTKEAKEFLEGHFCIKTLAGFGIADKTLAQQSCAALMGYLSETQKGNIGHINKITFITPGQFVSLDKSTMTNLELFSTIRERETKGSLLSLLDQTQTAMGGRLLKSWIAQPLTSAEAISDRQEAVRVLLDNPKTQQILRELLKEIPDVERIFSRLCVGIGNARDLNTLKQSLKIILLIKHHLKSLPASLIKFLDKQIHPDLEQIIKLVDSTITEEPPVSVKEGNLIKPGVKRPLDNLRRKVKVGREWIMSLEAKERERTGINSLKVRFNKVFGFYIEVSRVNVHLVPDNYFRKQTLVNGERFITPELKRQEEIILSGEETINEMEYEIFHELLRTTFRYTEKIQAASRATAVLDLLSNFAFLARGKRYIRPKIIYSGEIKIKAGRHPVVEDLLDTPFVPNDVLLNQTNRQLLIITGPNMAGKSVFIRQVALIVLMAQIGSFVPAEKAYISLVDKIFVRSGASDMITSGLSTFMVEMMETAHILNHASKNSLIVMDEIGRGTSTYDGISIAWAVAEHLVSGAGEHPKTLFATHYHELQALESQFPQKIKNFHMAVEPLSRSSSGRTAEPVFLHTLMPGAASHSFGVAVAKLAGIPEPVINKALLLLHSLESRNLKANNSALSLKFRERNSPDQTMETIRRKLRSVEIHEMTPLEALNFLARLQGEINGEN